MGLLLIVLVLFALTGITAAVWGFVRPADARPDEGALGAARPEPPADEEER